MTCFNQSRKSVHDTAFIEPIAYVRHYAFFTLSHNPHNPENKKKSKMYLPKVTQLINGKIRTQNQDCVTLKSRALSILPDYLNTRLEIRPVTSVSLSKSQLLSASFLIY